jgi:hypothetical protein
MSGFASDARYRLTMPPWQRNVTTSSLPCGAKYLSPLCSTTSSGSVVVFVDQGAEDLGPLDGSVVVGTDVDVDEGRQLL